MTGKSAAALAAISLPAPDKPRVLAIGAHPDDIEIGAGAFVCKANTAGWETHLLILTDSPGNAGLRRAEAVRAAGELGIPKDRVLFMGMPDGHLRVDADSVRVVRELMAQRGLRPDVVVTHTEADSHNDHVEASRIAHAVFRGSVFLHYSIHVSSEADRFAPRMFVEVSADRLRRKANALRMHASQTATIGRRDLSEYEHALGALARLERAEAFEVAWQSHAAHVLDKTILLSDSPFHRLWVPIVGDGDVTLLYGSYDSSEWAAIHGNAGRDRLRQAFIDQWVPSCPLREQYANAPEATRIAARRSVIIAGGARANQVFRKCYQSLESTVWTVGGEPTCLRNRFTGKVFNPEFTLGGAVRRDFGVIAWLPGRARGVCVAGATSYGTRSGMEFLADPGSHPALLEALLEHSGAQVAFTVDAATAAIEIIDVHPGGAC